MPQFRRASYVISMYECQEPFRRRTVYFAEIPLRNAPISQSITCHFYVRVSGPGFAEDQSISQSTLCEMLPTLFEGHKLMFKVEKDIESMVGGTRSIIHYDINSILDASSHRAVMISFRNITPIRSVVHTLIRSAVHTLIRSALDTKLKADADAD
ncbi:hypothetical protein LXL04_024095 [Taraxacum kok-saghyz]